MGSGLGIMVCGIDRVYGYGLSCYWSRGSRVKSLEFGVQNRQ